MINPRGLIVLLFAVVILLTVCVRARADDWKACCGPTALAGRGSTNR